MGPSACWRCGGVRGVCSCESTEEAILGHVTPTEASARSSGAAIGGPLEALPLPAPGSAVNVINDQLGIDGAITLKGDQLKCYTRDIEEGGVSKTYLGASECHVLARAFAALAAQFTSVAEKKP